LLVQSFGPGQRLDRVGKHPVDGIFGRHVASPAVRPWKISQFHIFSTSVETSSGWIVFSTKNRQAERGNAAWTPLRVLEDLIEATGQSRRPRSVQS
jgi:hypothetical protein